MTTFDLTRGVGGVWSLDAARIRDRVAVDNQQLEQLVGESKAVQTYIDGLAQEERSALRAVYGQIVRAIRKKIIGEEPLGLEDLFAIQYATTGAVANHTRECARQLHRERDRLEEQYPAIAEQQRNHHNTRKTAEERINGNREGFNTAEDALRDATPGTVRYRDLQVQLRKNRSAFLLAGEEALKANVQQECSVEKGYRVDKLIDLLIVAAGMHERIHAEAEHLQETIGLVASPYLALARSTETAAPSYKAIRQISSGINLIDRYTTEGITRTNGIMLTLPGGR